MPSLRRTTVVGFAAEGYCSHLLIAPDLDDEQTYDYVAACRATAAGARPNGGTPKQRFRAEAKPQLPAKQPGRHRWVVFSAYVISDGQAATAADGTGDVTLTPELLWTFSIGCIDCEEPFEHARATRCKAEAYVDREPR